MLSENKKIKILGVAMLLLSLFMFIPLAFVLLVVLGDIKSFSVLLIFSIFLLYFSIKYLINKPFKQNIILGKALIGVGIIYFIYEFLVYKVFFWDLADRHYFSSAASISPSFVFAFCLYLILLGVGLNYFSKNHMTTN